VGYPKGLSSREAYSIPWVVQDNGEDDYGFGIVVGVFNDYEAENWAMRREIRANDRNSVPLVNSYPQFEGGLCCRDNYCSRDFMVGWNVPLL
jgi:hypothetical protein